MATTPRRSWPTPDNTDRVADGASAIRALGDAIDNGVPILEILDDTTGTVPAGTVASQAITFGYTYSVAPSVIGTVNTGGTAVLTVSSITTTGCTVNIKNIGSVSIAGTFSVLVIAA